MDPLTARGAVLQGRSHNLAIRALILHAGRAVYEMSVYPTTDQLADRPGQVLSSRVTADVDRPTMRSLAISLVDPTGELSRTDAGQLLSPYDAEVQPWRGVVLPSGVPDWVPLGVFPLTRSEVSDSPSGTVLDLTGLDRAKKYQVPLPGPVTINAGTPVERAIRELLSRVNGGLRYRPWITGRTVGPLLYEADAEAWDSALDLAESVGCRLFHDRRGVCVLAPYAGGSAATTSLRFERTLLKVTRSEDADNIHNVVTVQSSESGIGKITATARDVDLTSPTYYNGPFGSRPLVITNPYVGTPAQALEAAQARLIQELGRSEEVSWECVPDAQVDPGDMVVVNRPTAGLFDRQLVVSTISLPLGVDGTMKITARKSIITQAGGIV